VGKASGNSANPGENRRCSLALCADPDALAAFSFWPLTVTSSSKPVDIQALDQLTGGVFTAATSGERSARLRDWLLTEPSVEQMNEVYHELSGREDRKSVV
jgi:ATP-dependent RNA helicase SUPV3L1/SUV3